MEEKPKQIIPVDRRGGHYSNMVHSQVTPNEVILSFFMVSGIDEPPATMVSRVVLSRDTAHQLSLDLRRAIEENKEQSPE